MVGRIILSVCVIVFVFIFWQVIEQKVAPSFQTDLVIKGVENPETMNTNQAVVRGAQKSYNWLSRFVYLVGFGLFFIIWIKPIIRMLEILLNNYN